jgi:hypothetical protein
MPYVRTSGGRHIALAHLAHRVRRGMGQSGEVPVENVGTPGGDIVPIDTTPIDTSGGGPSIDWASVIKAGTQAGLSTAQIIKSLQPPALVPGTQAVYNPQTGQFYNPTTGQVVNPSGSSTLNLSAGLSPNLLLYGGLAFGGLLLVMMLGKR